jgi:tetratricopeptide (TPR) repeat protein
MDLLFEEPKPKKPSGESLDQLVLPDLEELERSVFGRESAGPQSAQTVQEAPAAPSQAPPPSHEAEPAAPEPPAEAEADGEMVELIDSAATPLVAELEQIDFFIEQELYDDALRMLAQLEQQYPEDGDVRERRLLLKSKGILLEDVALDSGSTPSEEALFADEEGFVDLAAELEQELAEEDAMVEEATGHGHEEAQLSEVFREFQKGVAEQLSEEDSDTHFNLGIAYKEMGLLSEAIGEFQISSRNDEFFVSACSMIGVCYLEMGMPQQAAEWYRKALTLESMTQDDRLGILYDLGSALETAGEIEEAYATFSEILAINPAFRDVQVRLKQLDASSGSQRQVN